MKHILIFSIFFGLGYHLAETKSQVLPGAKESKTLVKQQYNENKGLRLPRSKSRIIALTKLEIEKLYKMNESFQTQNATNQPVLHTKNDFDI